MKEKSNSIKFPPNRSKSRESHDEYHHEFHDFEAWETLVELREAEDYPGLVRYCKRRADRFPDDPYSQFYLGEAYVLNGDYEKAIEFLSKHHRKQPDNMDFQHLILNALFALDKTEDDFDWTEKPVILRMSDDFLNICYEYLKPKRKPRSIIELYTEFVMNGYLLFTVEDLFKGLVQDQRFIVDNLDAGPLFAEVRVARR
jgi:tetratricopeptide (TPR) repeat protein